MPTIQSFWAPTKLGATEAGRQQRRFERDCVRRVLATFGLTEHEADLIADHKKVWGRKEAWLTFESFYGSFPTFPVALFPQSFYRATATEPVMKLSFWQRDFENTFIWRRYCAVLRHYRALCAGRHIGGRPQPSLCGLPAGMPFNYDGIPGGLILHDGEPLTKGFRSVVEATAVPDPLGPPEPIRCWIEPFGPWLAALAERGWSPSQRPNPLVVEAASPRPAREAAIPLLPWAVRALGGPGADAVLLSWLYHVRRADPAAHPRAVAFRSFRDGRRCVVASHADLGFVLRLSEKQVKSAVARLRKEGFVHAERGRNEYGVKTIFVLDDERCSDAAVADRDALDTEDWPAEWEEFRAADEQRRAHAVTKLHLIGNVLNGIVGPPRESRVPNRRGRRE